MQTIHVSPDFPLNRRMRKAVRRGKLEVVREGEEKSAIGGGSDESEAGKAEWDNMRKAGGQTGEGTLLENSILTMNEKGNAIDYLAMAVRALVELRNNPYAWKWVLISLHGAIYGFAVCAAKHTDGGKNVRQKDGRLHSIREVIEICEDEKWMRRLTISKPLSLSDRQRQSLEKLYYLRNLMAHFTPNFHWTDLPDGNLVIDCLEVVKAVALETRTTFWEQDERCNIAALCAAGVALARNYILTGKE